MKVYFFKKFIGEKRNYLRGIMVCGKFLVCVLVCVEKE